jgi:hypothetical protein
LDHQEHLVLLELLVQLDQEEKMVIPVLKVILERLVHLALMGIQHHCQQLESQEPVVLRDHKEPQEHKDLLGQLVFKG